MPSTRRFLLCILSAAALASAGCATSGGDGGPVLAMGPLGDDPVLPDTIVLTPASFSVDDEEGVAAAPVQVAMVAVSPATATVAAAKAEPEVKPVGFASPAKPAAGALAVAPAAPAVVVIQPQIPPPSAPAPIVPLSAIEKPTLEATAVAYAPRTPSGAQDRAEVDRLIRYYAVAYEVPEELVRRVVKRESNFRPKAYNRGHWGLMQIKHATARGMGYDGPADGLLDAETNLRFAVRYLRGAWMVAGGDHDKADKLYQRGYYYDAKRAGLLDETGLGRDRTRHRAPST